MSRGWRAGLLVLLLEAGHAVVLLPLASKWVPDRELGAWVAMHSGLGLVQAAAAAYSQPLIRMLASGRPRRATRDWPDVLRRCDRTGHLLLGILQVPFACVLVPSMSGWQAEWIGALTLFFVAMHLRLAAMNRFVLTNGLRLVGYDKRMLATASACTLGLGIVLAAVSGSILGLALATVAGAFLLRWKAGMAAARLSIRPARGTLGWPDRRRMISLLVLGLSGYLNLGTDVLVANRLLDPPQAIAYALWTRALFVSLALVGLYAQLRFPFWASLPRPLAARELRRAAIPIGLIVPAAGAAWVLLAAAAPSSLPARLDPAIVVSMAVSYALACGVVLLGQYAIARGVTGFALPCAVVASSAPFVALAWGRLGAAERFMFGYAAVNAVLLLVVWGFARYRPEPVPDRT